MLIILLSNPQGNIPSISHSYYHDDNVLQVLSVSEDTHKFLTITLGLADCQISRIVNAVESKFKPSNNKKKIYSLDATKK